MTPGLGSEVLRSGLIALIVLSGTILVALGRLEVSEVETPTAMIIGYLVALPQRIESVKQTDTRESDGPR